MASKRVERGDEVQSIGDNSDLSWLIADEDSGSSLDRMKEYRILPRAKVIQSLSADELKEQFGEGSVLLMPGNTLICKKGQSFDFVPVFFYPEFTIVNDREDKASPMFHARSLDEDSEIARLCKDKQKRFIPYGDPDKNGNYPYMRRAVEYLNFPGLIYGDHPMAGTACTVSFAKGDFQTGKSWISSIWMRKVGKKPVDLYKQVWTMTSTTFKGPKGNWFGLQPTNPEERSIYIQPDELEQFKAAWEEYSELYAERRLMVDHESVETDDENSYASAAEESEV